MATVTTYSDFGAPKIKSVTLLETMETVTNFIFWAPKSLQMLTAAMKLKDACSLEENL